MRLLSLLVVVAASCCFMIPVGYEFNIQNAVYSSFSNLTDREWIAFAAMWPLGAAVGSLTSPLLVERFSRKFSLFVLPNLCLLVGGVLPAFAAVWTLILGRLLFGFGAGTIFSILPLYAAEICDVSVIVVGGSVNAAFWLGCAAASGLGLDRVLGGDGFWPFFALIAPFMVCMTLILSPLFPESPESVSGSYPVLKGLDSETSVLIESRPPPWAWSDEGCRKLAATSVLVGAAWASFAPFPLFASARQILTSSYLNYSASTAGSIEACVATIYASLALLSFALLFLDRWKKAQVATACVASSMGLLSSLIFVLTAEYGSISSWTGKMGFLFSFLLCAVGYQTVLTPNFYVAPFLYCKNHHRRIWCYALLNAAAWSTFLVWTLAFGELADHTSGWSLLPFLVVSAVLPACAYSFWRRRRPKIYGSGRASFFASTESGSKASSSYGTFQSAK